MKHKFFLKLVYKETRRNMAAKCMPPNKVRESLKSKMYLVKKLKFEKTVTLKVERFNPLH